MSGVAVLVTSHGEFARYALDSAEMIVGKQENCGVVSVTMDFTLEDAIEKMKEEIKKLDCREGLVILADLFGGTPSNVSGRFVLEQDNIQVLTGLNLPMLLDLLSNRNRDLKEIATSLQDTYQQGFHDMNKEFSEGEDEDDSELL